MHQGVVAYLTRRASLLTLGSAGLATAAPPLIAEAKKKKKKKKKKGDVNQFCKKQVDQCLTFLTATCADEPECLIAVQTCCPEFGTCDFSGFFDCLAPFQN